MSAPVRVDRMIARVLLLGGVLSVSLVLGGLVLYAVQGRETGRAVDVFTSLGDVRRALAQHPPDPLAVTALGLVCLLVTPVLGVAVAAVAFWRAGDRDYAAIAGVVLGMLLLSFVLAVAG